MNEIKYELNCRFESLLPVNRYIVFAIVESQGQGLAGATAFTCIGVLDVLGQGS